jgi:hypothetical protein
LAEAAQFQGWGLGLLQSCAVGEEQGQKGGFIDGQGRSGRARPAAGGDFARQGLGLGRVDRAAGGGQDGADLLGAGVIVSHPISVPHTN